MMHVRQQFSSGEIRPACSLSQLGLPGLRRLGLPVVCAAALWLPGCGGETPDVTPSTLSHATSNVGQLSRFSATLSDVVTTVVWVDWETDVPGTGWVEYGLGDLTLRTPVDASATTHRVAVLGLKSDQAYDFRAVTQLEDGTELSSEVVSLDTVGPQGLGAVVVAEYDATQMHSTDAFFVVSVRTNESSFIVLLDRDGDVVWFMEAVAPSSFHTPRITRDGTGIIWAEWDRDKQIDLGRITRISLSGEDHVSTAAPHVHHDFVEHDDGTVGYITTDIRDLGNPVLTLSDQIKEIQMGAPDTDDPSEVWSFFDDYGIPFWHPCDDSVENVDRWGLSGADEWTHANSLMYSRADDAYYIQPRFFDALVKFDRGSGEVLWQIGGEYGNFTKSDGDPAFTSVYQPQLWSHGHMSHIWEDGFMYYDNGNHRSPRQSKVSEYAYNTQTMTVEEVWSFTDGRFMSYLSDVRKLDNGNVFILSSPAAELSEVTQAGDVVWRATMPDDGVTFGRASYIGDVYELTSSLLHP